MKKKIVAALLITVMTAGIFSGCGNRMEGDGRVQAAMATAGDGSNLDSEATAEPTAEPESEATAEPTAKPTPEATAEPTAEPESEATAEPTAEPATTQASIQGTTTQAQMTSQQPVVSAKAVDVTELTVSELLEPLLTSDDAEVREMAESYNSETLLLILARAEAVGLDGLYTPEFIEQLLACNRDYNTPKSYTSEFLELLNADRRAAGLPEVSAGADYLESQALKRAKELTSSPAQYVGGGATFESVGATGGTDVASAYSIFKQTSGTWGQLMDENLENVSLARCGTMWALEGYVKAVAIIIDANHPAPDDSSAIPEIPQIPDEELELKSSTDSTDTYGSSNVTVLTPEEDAAIAAQWGWDW